MAHDLIIILDRIERLKGEDGGGGTLGELKTLAIALDARFSPESLEAQAEAAHEWLHNLQHALEYADNTFSALVNECPAI